MELSCESPAASTPDPRKNAMHTLWLEFDREAPSPIQMPTDRARVQ